MGGGHAFRQGHSTHQRGTQGPSVHPLWTQSLMWKNPQQSADLQRVYEQDPGARLLGVYPWVHSPGHISAQTWVSCLLAQGSFWCFSVQGPMWSDKRTWASPGPASGSSHHGQRGVSCQTTPTPGLTQLDKRECSPTYKVDRAPWRTLQKKSVGQYLMGTRCSSPGRC